MASTNAKTNATVFVHLLAARTSTSTNTVYSLSWLVNVTII